MSMLKFAEDFTRLVSRYTRNSSNNDPSNEPLTDHEILYTVRHVLHVLIQDFDGRSANNLMLETSDNANAGTALESSVVETKREPGVEDTCRSQATQPVVTDPAVSDISLNIVKKEREDSFTLQNEKKFMSQSNPAICVSRSDTFVREENQKINTEDQKDVFEDFTNTETDDLSRDLSLSVSLNEIRKSALDIVAALNNIKQLFLQSRGLTKRDMAKVQQSSGYSSFRRTSTMNKTKMSTNSISGSLTSSKLLATENRNISERRKSTGGIGTSAAIVGKSGKSTKVDNSVSNLNVSACNKAPPGPSSEYQPKFTKNPKYAHVQSTIPKIIQKKKVQQLQKTSEIFI